MTRARDKAQKAISVVVRDPFLYDFLKHHDPMALEQLRDALNAIKDEKRSERWGETADSNPNTGVAYGDMEV